MTSLQKMLFAIDDLPTVPETLLRILNIIDNPDSSAQALADVVRLDAPLTAKVLRLANSPYYGGRGQFAEVRICVAVLGFRTIRQLAICVSVATSLIAACNKSRTRLDYRELWRHSVATAAISKQLALRSSDPDPEEVFTAGLLHDLGKFVLIVHAAEQYDQVVAQRRRAGNHLTEVEMDMLGFDHAMAGETFGRTWRFPESLTCSARWHHGTCPGPVPSTRPQRLAALVGLADFLANSWSPPASDLGFDPALARADLLWERAELAEDEVQRDRASFLEAVRRAGAFLELA